MSFVQAATVTAFSGFGEVCDQRSNDFERRMDKTDHNLNEVRCMVIETRGQLEEQKMRPDSLESRLESRRLRSQIQECQCNAERSGSAHYSPRGSSIGREAVIRMTGGHLSQRDNPHTFTTINSPSNVTIDYILASEAVVPSKSSLKSFQNVVLADKPACASSHATALPVPLRLLRLYANDV